MTDRLGRRARRRSPIDPDRADLTLLALRARDGDQIAEAAFIRRTSPDVTRYCAHMVGADHAEDVAQATYIRALRSLRSFRGESSAKTWLLGVARHACLDELRSRGRRRRLVERLVAEPVAESEPAGHPSDVAHAIEAIEGLEPERREAFVLTQILGHSYEEAAAIVGCPVGTIRSRVARGRREVLADLDRTDGLSGLEQQTGT